VYLCFGLSSTPLNVTRCRAIPGARPLPRSFFFAQAADFATPHKRDRRRSARACSPPSIPARTTGKSCRSELVRSGLAWPFYHRTYANARFGVTQSLIEKAHRLRTMLGLVGCGEVRRGRRSLQTPKRTGLEEAMQKIVFWPASDTGVAAAGQKRSISGGRAGPLTPSEAIRTVSGSWASPDASGFQIAL
jgi:hypothetical protein